MLDEVPCQTLVFGIKVMSTLEFAPACSTFKLMTMAVVTYTMSGISS